jgi:hypothetical protein
MNAHPVPNIGPGGIRYRARWGSAVLLAALGLAVLFIAADWPRLIRLTLLPLWYLAGLGLFQAREKT